jgi:hypothetical protein
MINVEHLSKTITNTQWVYAHAYPPMGKLGNNCVIKKHSIINKTNGSKYV